MYEEELACFLRRSPGEDIKALKESCLLFCEGECSSCEMEKANGTNERRKKKIRAWRRKSKEAYALFDAILDLDEELRRPFLPLINKRKKIFQMCTRCGANVPLADLYFMPIGF